MSSRYVAGVVRLVGYPPRIRSNTPQDLPTRSEKAFYWPAFMRAGSQDERQGREARSTLDQSQENCRGLDFHRPRIRRDESARLHMPTISYRRVLLGRLWVLTDLALSLVHKTP